MDMTPQIDHLERVRHYEQPEGRFGSEHLVRDEIPAVNPEINDLLERQEDIEAEFLDRMAARKGSIAVADVVTFNTSHRPHSSFDTPTGLYR